MTNLPAEEDDRAVVRISAVCDDWVVDGSAPTMHHTGNASSETYVREYWTLVMRDGQLDASRRSSRTPRASTSSPPRSSPSSGDDVAGMRDETVVEQAVADRAPRAPTSARSRRSTSPTTPRRRRARWPWSTSASSPT